MLLLVAVTAASRLDNPDRQSDARNRVAAGSPLLS
jgi:hypothetical protein